MNELALFAGAGGGILGGHLLGWRCVCAVEYDHYARSVLVARQNDGCLPPFPIWDDVRTFDGRPWRGRVDVVSGGFPCQDISAAGKGAGITGARSGLWAEMARIVGEVRPRYVWVENSPMLVRRGLGLVLSDLAALGFSARWGVVGAHHAGAPHKRDRIWVLAYADGGCLHRGGTDASDGGTVPPEGIVGVVRGGDGSEDVADAQGKRSLARLCGNEAGQVHQLADCGDAADADRERQQEQRQPQPIPSDQQREAKGPAIECGGWWGAEPDVGRVAHGVAARVDRLRCIGNGQVPRVVQRAWEELNDA